FPAFMDLEVFSEREPVPLPPTPAALFVGVLELYKNVDGLARVWRLVAQRLPAAHLRIVGRGSRADVVRRLVDELPAQTTWAASPEDYAARVAELVRPYTGAA